MKDVSPKYRLLLANLVAFGLLALPRVAVAQQITYYDFDEPQSTPGQTSFQCSPNNLSTTTLFCFNNISGATTTPAYVSDTYPAIIDPNPAEVPPAAGPHFAVQVTPSTGSQSSSLWFAVPQKVSNGFTAYFAFKFTPNPNSYATADGIAFVIQNALGGGTSTTSDGTTCAEKGSGPTVVGGDGGCIGYGGIDNSLAIELDTYHNSWDPQDIPGSSNDNHIAIQNCGPSAANSPDHTGSCLVSLGGLTPAITSALNGVTLADGNVHQVVITYSGPTEATPNQLQIFIDPLFNPGTHTPVAGSLPVLSGTYNLAANLNLINSGSAQDSAYVGFTSSTGGAFENHELMAWTYTPHTPVTQEQPIAQGGQPTVFPFGAHVYAVTYPASVPTSGISMVVTANTISPTLFSQLVGNSAFAGSQCQVYDETGGNCIVYSVSCVETSTSVVVPCPSTDPTDPTTAIPVKSAYNNSVPPVNPGYLQGDPFYSLLTSISGNGNTATVTCAGECAVTTGQTVTISGTLTGSNPSGYNSTVTVLSADPSVPNVFTFASGGTTTATGGYITSNNLKNIFTGYQPQRIDGTTTGKTHNFSDFIVTAVTQQTSTITVNSISPNPVAVLSPVNLAFTVAGNPALGPNTPGGNYTVTSSVLGDPSCAGTLSPAGTATCSLTFLTAGPRTLTISYLGDINFAATTTPVQITVNPGSKASVSPSSLDFGTLYLGSISIKAVTLTNTGAAPMTIKEPFLFDVGNGDSREFIALSLCPSTLGAGRSCKIYVTFLAGPQYTTQTAILKINDNAPGSPQSVPLTANVINPRASFSPTAIKFGTVGIGSSAQATVQLTNTGATPLAISNRSIQGANASEFTQTTTCSSSLPAGGSCSFLITFKPIKTGARTAYLSVTDSAQSGTQQVQLSGTGK